MKAAKDIVNKLIDSWNRKDLDAVESLINDNVVINWPLSEIRGKEAFMRFAKEMNKSLRQLRVKDQFEKGSSVVTILEVVLEVPDGELVIQAAEYAKVENGKLASYTFYADQSEFKKHFGIDPQGIPFQREYEYSMR